MTSRKTHRKAVGGCRHLTAASILLLLLVLVLPGVSGCARLIRPPQNQEPALRLITRWTAQNADLLRFKGIVRVQLNSPRADIGGRAAVAGELPDRLRLEFMTPIGQPVLRFSGDGQTITLIDLHESDIRRWAQTDTALERLIGAPLGIEDLLDIFVGRPPLPEFAAAQISKDHHACTVSLISRWHEVLAEIHSEPCGRPGSLETYSRRGELQYSIHWLKWQTIDEFVLPKEVLITSGDGERARLVLERFWPNEPLLPGTFELEHP